MLSNNASSNKSELKTPFALAALAAIIVCIGLTIFGLWHGFDPKSLPFEPKAYRRLIGLIILSALIILACARIFRISLWAASAATLGLFSMVAGAGWSLVVVGLLGLSSMVLGQRLFRLLGIDTGSRSAELICGIGTFGYVIGMVAQLPVHYRASYAMLILLPLILFREQTLRLIKECWHARLPAIDKKPLSATALELAICVVAMVHAVVAFIPEIGHDALAMHLFVPAHLETRHQWQFDVTYYVWAVMPMLGDWIFAAAYLLDGENAARLTNVCFMLLIAIFVRAAVLWAHGSVRGANWAMLLFLSMPLTFTESSSLFIESIWTVFVVAGVIYVCRACERGNTATAADIVVAGIFLGFAVSAKAVTLTLLPVLLIYLLIHFRQWATADYRNAVLVGIACFFVLAAFPYVNALIRTGNPLFPFYNAIFQSPYFAAENFSDLRWPKGLTWDWLYVLTFQPTRFIEGGRGAMGIAGFQWLLLLVPASILLLGSRLRRGLRMLVLGIGFIALTTMFITYLRYIFPGFTLLCAAIGVALPSSENAHQHVVSVFLAALVSAVVLNLVYFNGAAQYHGFPTQAIISERARANYLEGNLPIRKAVDFVNRINSSGSPVAIFGPPMVAGLEADALHAGWYNPKFEKDVASLGSAADLAKVLKKWNAKIVILQSGFGRPALAEYVERIATRSIKYGDISVWTVNGDELLTEELLRSKRFGENSGWRLDPDVRADADGSVLVSERKPAVQVVAVTAGRRYLNTVLVSCAEQVTRGRLQINWLDAEQKYLSTSAETYDCTPEPKSFKMDVVAPRGAAFAYVYASSHFEVPIRMYENSLKQ